MTFSSLSSRRRSLWSLWSAGAWYRFGSQLITSPSSGAKPVRNPPPFIEESKRARLPALRAQWNFCSNRIDYQSGSEQPHSKGCRHIKLRNALFSLVLTHRRNLQRPPIEFAHVYRVQVCDFQFPCTLNLLAAQGLQPRRVRRGVSLDQIIRATARALM